MIFNLFKRKRYKVTVKGEGMEQVYNAYRLTKADHYHVKLTTDQGKLVDIKTTAPMDIIVEDL